MTTTPSEALRGSGTARPSASSSRPTSSPPIRGKITGFPIDRGGRIKIAIAVIATILAAIFQHVGAPSVLTFVTAACSLAMLATLVGDGTEQIGSRLGPGATGVLQSALGNLPELFIGIFLLRKGPDQIPTLQAALVGSVLGNSLLVLGLAFFLGGLRHGTQTFEAEPIRNIASLTFLAAAALAIPTLASQLHTTAAAHTGALSVACAAVLLLVFAANIPFSLRGKPTLAHEDAGTPWPIWLAVLVLVAAGIGSVFVSDWFVNALVPAEKVLGLSAGFTGLVIVAIAGNAVENVVGVQLMMKNKPEYAISVILNSSLQVALALIPALVLLSYVIGGAHLSLVLSPLLLGSLLLATILIAFTTYDGESTWLEGASLIGLYAIVAAAFWWG